MVLVKVIKLVVNVHWALNLAWEGVENDFTLLFLLDVFLAV